MKVPAILIATIVFVSTSFAQEMIQYKPADPSSDQAEITAVLTRPAAGSEPNKRFPAVVLLHAGWGWEVPVTTQYAKALNAAGFVTLEPRLFRNSSERRPAPNSYSPEVFGALQYLASRPDVDPKKIALAGFSYGGAQTVGAATAFIAMKHAGASGLKFAAHAPFYPVCWSYVAFMRGKYRAPIPSDMFTKWSGAPIRIFAGGLDDVDDRDPKACEDFVAEVPTEYRTLFSVKLYPNATHGWDQPAAEFHDPIACKGRGCINRNVPDPNVTKQSIADLVEFFSTTVR